MTFDLAIVSTTIIPVRPRSELIENHTILINNGVIEAIVPNEEFKPENAQTVVNCEQKIIMPGLINCHTHMAMNLFRGLADDLPLMTWLENHIFPAENKWVSEEFVRAGVEHAIAEMLKGGTTCYNDMYFFPEVCADVTTKAHMRGAIGITIFDFPCAWGNGPNDYFTKGQRFIEYVKDNPLITATYAPHAPYTVSDENLKRVRADADKYSKLINIHLHETDFEVESSLKQYGMRPIERLAKLGLLNDDVIAVHMTAINEDDIKLTKKFNTNVVTCPESNLKLASGFCPVEHLRQANINVAIGTDGAASNNDLDMFGEMKTTAILAKGVSKQPTAIDAMTALEMATINGAKTLGISNQVGSVEVGKKADLIALDIDSLNMQPLYNPISQAVYAAQNNNVCHVWVNGKQVVDNRKLTTINESDVISMVKNWQTKIRAKNE